MQTGGFKGRTREVAPERFVESYIAEQAMVGMAVGLAMNGMRPVYMHNRPDFVLLAVHEGEAAGLPDVTVLPDVDAIDGRRVHEVDLIRDEHHLNLVVLRDDEEAVDET